MGDIFGDKPDPAEISANTIKTARAVGGMQTQANQAAQRSSMVDQSNPWANVSYVRTGTDPYGAPIYKATVGASGEAAPLWAQMFAGKALAGGQGNALIGGANYGSVSPTDVIGDMSTGLTNQRMASYLQSVDPFFKTKTEQLDTRLRNQGLLPGQPGYDNAMREQQNTQGLTVAGAAANYAPEAFKQASSLYTMPLTMAQQLADWGTPQDPNKSIIQTPGMQPADYTGAAAVGAKAAGDQYKAEMDQYSGALKGASDLAGAGAMMMFSDERIKEDIDEVGSLHDGTPVYKYNYIGDPTPRIGLMAQDVEKTNPDAVKEFGGIKAVNYDKATARSRAMKALLG